MVYQRQGRRSTKNYLQQKKNKEWHAYQRQGQRSTQNYLQQKKYK